jgi:outer membrane cobalamin receptor
MSRTPPRSRPPVGLDEIVVTAERREQSVQTPPFTIQVLGGDAVARAVLSTPTDVSKLSTGAEIGTGGGNAQI